MLNTYCNACFFYRTAADIMTPLNPRHLQAPFHHCRLLFSQLGLAGWELRSQLHLLSKNEKLLRELRNLDTQVSVLFRMITG